MLTIMKCIFMFMLFLSHDVVAAEQQRPDEFCLRCHGMETLAARDRTTGRLVSYFVKPDALHRSVHHRQSCQACHQGEGFHEFPHTGLTSKETLSCGGCHREDKRYRFERIEAQMTKGVHRLRCYDCHDPHQWMLERNLDPQVVIQQSNAMCRQCHTEAADKRHRWLPKRDQHWEQVRCVDCHTPRPGSIVHTVQSAAMAEQQCEACHTRDSVLLGKLYRYRMREESHKHGLLSSLVLNDAYVIGMTRNELLDRGIMVVVVLTIVGVVGHGLGRWLAHLRRNADDA